MSKGIVVDALLLAALAVCDIIAIAVTKPAVPILPTVFFVIETTEEIDELVIRYHTRFT